MKGALKLDKKQKISWGVSFGSLALVAGMVSYLGLTNGEKADNRLAANQPSPSNRNSFQQDNFGSQNGQAPEQGYKENNGLDNSSPFSENEQGNSFNNSDEQMWGDNSQQGQFLNEDRGNYGHHSGFDTTTGGT